MVMQDGSPAAARPRWYGGGSTRVRSGIGLMLFALLLSSCVFSGGARSETLPPGPHVVSVAMDEYAFDFEAPEERGRVELRVRNVGDEAHELVLVQIPEDFPPMAEFLHDDKPQALQTVAKLPERAPGEEGTLAVDLAPGRYGLVCFVEGPDGEKHARKGMHAEFRLLGSTEQDEPSHDHSGDDHEPGPAPTDEPAGDSGQDATSPSTPPEDQPRRVQPVPEPPSPGE